MSAAPKSLLLVEDDVQLRLLLSVILTHSGYRVRVAEDGFSALAAMRVEVPHLVVSDLYMAGMSGFELLSVIRRRFPAVAVIAMSSAFSGEEVPAGVAADAFYQKATSVFSLLRVVEETSGRELPLREESRGETAPIWIAAHPQGEPAHRSVVVACPECLRTSAHVPGLSLAPVRSTECAYCRTPIHYAVVQTVDAGPAKPLWQPGSSGTAPLNLSAKIA
jgi:CheY-like chemotaxis protein